MKSNEFYNNETKNTSSSGRDIFKQCGNQRKTSEMLRGFSKNGRKTTTIKITTSIIRKMTEHLEELINETNKYQTTKTIKQTSETLINRWTILKNLNEKKGRDNVAPVPQNNPGICSHDLSSDWKLEKAKEWKEKSSEKGYRTEELMGQEGIVMILEKCTGLQQT